jgi:BirA family biotin operon repressor/biotin-[acetyl-CoA-carboxylase] ligase
LFQSLLKGQIIGGHYLFIPQVASTNSYCKELLNSNTPPPEGLVIQAGHQTQGKGQMGNAWLVGANKNLTYSCIIYPSFISPTEQFYLNMAVSLSVAELLDEYIGNAKIKWPNDIYINNKKIGGILIENSLMGNKIQSSIIGIGININQNSFEGLPHATSLFMELGVEYPLTYMLQQWCALFEGYLALLKSRSFGSLTKLYLQRMWQHNKTVHYHKNNILHTGIIKGVNPLGQLLIDENGEQVVYNFKEISFVI